MTKGQGALLLIFVRNPLRGQVKTRLAATMGPAKALDIYRQLLRHTQQVAAQLSVPKWVYYSDYVPSSDLFSRALFSKKLQRGADLGARMRHAFEEAFAADYAPVLIIGSDCWTLQLSHLEEALEALRKQPYVLGPAQDGGYYLLGMQHPRPDLFINIDWSTDQVLRQTISRLPTGSYHLLPQLNDIDTATDLLEV